MKFFLKETEMKVRGEEGPVELALADEFSLGCRTLYVVVRVSNESLTELNSSSRSCWSSVVLLDSLVLKVTRRSPLFLEFTQPMTSTQ